MRCSELPRFNPQLYHASNQDSEDTHLGSALGGGKFPAVGRAHIRGRALVDGVERDRTQHLKLAERLAAAAAAVAGAAGRVGAAAAKRAGDRAIDGVVVLPFGGQRGVDEHVMRAVVPPREHLLGVQSQPEQAKRILLDIFIVLTQLQFFSARLTSCMVPCHTLANMCCVVLATSCIVLASHTSIITSC